jgi:YopT-type cysteine protease-like protein
MDVLNSIIAARVKSVQASAKGYSGSCTYAFSQMTSPVADIIGTDKTTKDGICEMLSARWVVENSRGRSLQAWLSAGGGNGVDASKIRLLMQLFIIGETMKPQQMVDSKADSVWFKAKQDQDTATQNFLLSNGIVRVPGNQGDWGKGDSGGGDKIKHLIARDLCDPRGGGRRWRMIGIWGAVGGHAMAFTADDSGCAFFDPNYGSFAFSSKSKFRDWFTDAFYPMAFYTKLLGKRYELLDYMKAG